jgi:hypothetical protein
MREVNGGGHEGVWLNVFAPSGAGERQEPEEFFNLVSTTLGVTRHDIHNPWRRF